jgi:peptidoglycan/LPS O-acetylase OafA/YrhL
MRVFHHRTEFGVIAVAAAGFALVALVTLVPYFSRLNWRWLTTAGALTYPFYLVHDRLGIVAIAVAAHSTSLPPTVILILVPIAMLLLAWLLHACVENPLAPRLKRALLR